MRRILWGLVMLVVGGAWALLLGIAVEGFQTEAAAARVVAGSHLSPYRVIVLSATGYATETPAAVLGGANPIQDASCVVIASRRVLVEIIRSATSNGSYALYPWYTAGLAAGPQTFPPSAWIVPATDVAAYLDVDGILIERGMNASVGIAGATTYRRAWAFEPRQAACAILLQATNVGPATVTISFD